MLPLMKYLIPFFILVDVVHAREFFEYGQSIRALGMGGAYTAVVKDSDALFYNPAALNRIEGINFSLLSLGVGVNGLQIYEDLQEVGSIDSSEDYESFYGKNIWLGVGGKSAVVLPHFGAGVYDSGFITARLNNPPFPSLDMTYINDYGIVVGNSFTISEQAAFGISLKRITRTGGTINLGPDAISAGENPTDAFQQMGTGYGMDMGFLYMGKGAMNPTLSLAWKDVGSTAFSAASGGIAPPRQKDDLAVGVSLGFDTALIGMTAAIDVKHLMDYDEPTGKKIHMGLELNLPFIDVRGGFYQGYSTMGVGIDLFVFRFDVASYSVEKGAYAGQTGDARIQASLTCELSFDPSFNFIDVDTNKKRRLKQRR